MRQLPSGKTQRSARTALCCGLIVALGVVPVSQADAETLSEAIAEAYRNNPSLKAEQADSRAADEVVAQAKAQYGPSINARASYGYTENRFAPSTAARRQSGFGTEYSVSLNQPLFTSGRLTANLEQARAGQGIGREFMRSASLGLLSDVVTVYVGVLRDQQLVEIAQQNVDILNGQLEQTNARFKARFATLTDLTQTQNRLAFGRAQLEIARGNLLSSRNSYRNVIGHYPGQLAPVTPLPRLPETLDDAILIADQQNPNLEIARLNERSSRAQVAAARADRGPNVALESSFGRTPVSLENDASRQTSLSAQVNVTMPIYTSGLLDARVREVLQRNDADNQRVEQASRDVREQVASLWDQLSAVRRAIPIYRAAVVAAESAVDGVRKQQAAGQATSLDVLDTTRDLLSSRTAEIQAEAQLFALHASLLAALGELDVADFDPIELRYELDDFQTTGIAGLPTGPLIELFDKVLYNSQPRHSPVAAETSSESGHDMAAEPSTSLAKPATQSPATPR